MRKKRRHTEQYSVPVTQYRNSDVWYPYMETNTKNIHLMGQTEDHSTI